MDFSCLSHPEQSEGSRVSEYWILTHKGCTGYRSAQNDEMRIVYKGVQFNI